MIMTDQLDTAAIRAQYSDGEYLDAYPGEACATILALCDALDELRRMLERAAQYLPYGIVRCYGDRCREPWCASCFGEEDVEEFMVKVKADRSAIRAALAQKGDQP